MDKNKKFKTIIPEIFKISTKIRFVAIIDLNGKIVISEMKPDLQSLLKKSNEEKFCEHVAVRRDMRHEFDGKLGKVSYVHVERENITQFVTYSKSHSFFITLICSGILIVSSVLKIQNSFSLLKPNFS